QETFVKAFETLLRDNGLTPQAVGRNRFTAANVLEEIRSTMKACSGTVVLAFERLRVDAGLEFPGAEALEDAPHGAVEPRAAAGRRLPTPWNHIEAGMASLLGHPLLVVVEEGIHQDGLLEERYGWFVQRIAFEPSALASRQFRGVFDDWIQRMKGVSVPTPD